MTKPRTAQAPIPDYLADERVVAIRECAAVIGCRVDWLYDQIKQGNGPRTVRFGARTSGVRVRDLKAWMESRATPADAA